MCFYPFSASPAALDFDVGIEASTGVQTSVVPDPPVCPLVVEANPKPVCKQMRQQLVGLGAGKVGWRVTGEPPYMSPGEGRAVPVGPCGREAFWRQNGWCGTVERHGCSPKSATLKSLL